MIAGIAAALLAVTAATRVQRWWFSRSLTLAGSIVVLICMSIHMALNMKPVEQFVRQTFGASMPGTIKMLLVCGICVGTAIIFTNVTSSANPKKILWIHISLSLFTAVLSFYFFFKTPWPASNPDNQTFDNEYAFLPGYAEGLMLGMTYPFLLCLLVTIVTIRQADRRTVTGRGLIIICPGAVALTTYAALRIGYLFATRYGWIDPTPTPFAISRVLAIVGVSFIAAGVLSALIDSFLAARSEQKMFSELHSELIDRWPGAQRKSERGSSAADRVADRAAELLDALSLEAKHRDLPQEGPQAQESTVAAIARWLITGRIPDGLGSADLRPRPGTTDVQWACILGDAYTRESKQRLASKQ